MVAELDKWAKRHCYPVDLGDDVKGYVKPMRFRDMDSLAKMEQSITSTQRTQWYLAYCLCDENAQTLVPEKASDETGDQFLARIDSIFGEWETPTISKAMEAIMKVISPTDPDTLVKN